MKKKMASIVVSFYITAAMISIVTGASNQFKVGESGGWRQPDANNTEMYNQWASHNRFLVGDSLYFEYKEDSVLVVDKRGYYHCNSSNPIFAFNDGKTVVKLDKPGPIYFISGSPDHCDNGQRLIVNVINVHPTPQSPPSSIAAPPQPFFPTDSPSPSPNPSSAVTNIAVSPILLIVFSTFITAFITFVLGAPYNSPHFHFCIRFRPAAGR